LLLALFRYYSCTLTVTAASSVAKAEPGLAALDTTVARLTKGAFPPTIISRAVPVGVAAGLLVGIFKIVEAW
jgi:hypothetical protein